MEQRPTQNRLQLLSQALSAAASSINLARQLINEIQREGGALEPPGLIGKYDGMFMVTEAGKKYPVPDNYAAKSQLIYGDKLKMLEGPEGRRFKHIEKIPRVEVEATLTVKDGRLVAVTPEGSYKLIQSAVRYLRGEEGDKVKILLPRDEKHAPFAAIVEVVGKKVKREERKAEAEKVVEEKKPVVKEAPPKKEEKAEKKPAAKRVAAEKKPKVERKAEEPASKKVPAKKGETTIAPPGEEELR